MQRSRIPSPARSQGATATPRRKKARSSRSLCSPALSTASGRLTSLIDQFKDKNMESFALSPLNGRSVLNDNTDIDEPRRKSWWKKLDDNSRDVLEVLEDNRLSDANNVVEELIDIDILSQEKKNYTLDLPESSDNESIHSIVLPQRRLFTQKENLPQKKFVQLIDNRESLAKLHKPNTTTTEKTVNVGTRELFQNKLSKPIFAAALLNISPNKTAADKTKENVLIEPRPPVRSIFGNRPANKRKNMFADFIVSESEDEIPEIQPKVFGFQKKLEQRRISSKGSPTSSITTDMEMDDWRMLPSSTMVENQIEDMMGGNTPVKRARLSKLSEAKESDAGTNTLQTNTTADKTKQSNKSASSKNKSKASPEIRNVSLNNSRTTRSMLKNASIIEENANMSLKQNSKANKSQTKTVKSDSNRSTLKVHNKPSTDDIEENQVDDENNLTLRYENDENEMNEEAATITKNNREAQMNKSKNKSNLSNKSIQKATKPAKIVEESVDSQNELYSADDNVDGNVEQDPKVRDKTEKSKEEISQEIEADISEVINENVADQSGVDEAHVSQDNDDEQNVSTEANESQEVENEEDESENEEEAAVDSDENEQANASDLNHESQATMAEVNESQEMDDHANESRMDDDNVASENEEDDVDEEKTANESEVEEANESQEVENDEEESQELENEAEVSQEVENDEEESQEQENEAEVSQAVENDEEESQELENEAEVSQEVENDQEESQELENEAEVSQEVENDQEESQEVDNDEEENEEAENDEEESREVENDEEESQEIENDEEQEQIESDAEVNQSEEIDNDQQMDNSDEDDKAIASDPEISEQDDDFDQADAMEVDDDDQQESDHDQSHQEERQNEVEPSTEEIAESPDVTHDTTGRHRKKHLNKSPEVIRHDKTNQMDSFTATGRNTSVRKTKSMIKNLHIRPSLAPPRNSTGFSDGTTNSSAEGSGWDSHRTTRKTLRQTFGKDFTPRKSLRALVMEKSAKRQTEHLDMHSETVKFPQANSTELPEISNRDDVEDFVESDHEVSIRTRQTTLEMYLEKIKQQNNEKKAKMQELVRNSLNKVPVRDPLNMFKVPNKPAPRRPKPSQAKPKKQFSSIIAFDNLPPELKEDLKYKPPKRFQPSNASWITKRLYKFLETKLEPKYDYKARVRSEKLVETIYHFTKDLRRHTVAPTDAVDVLKQELARLDVVSTHFEFYEFFHDFMPREVRIKVVPDIVNKIPLPRHGVFSKIIRGNTP